jgi:UDP-N-acetylmuramyl pentapeptide phosphotransferase/UDP-N-acetylglucosamine-1-phosphate transferase
MILTTVTIAVGSAAVVRVVRSIAIKKSLLDIPNERSSHRIAVPRLGGAAFVPIVLLAFGVLWPEVGLPRLVIWTVLGGALALYTISLVDDVNPLPSGIRLGIQLMVSTAVVWACMRDAPNSLAVIWVAPIGIVGVLNIYNFMDGIDGIAGVQAVAAGVTWTLIGGALKSDAAMILGCCLTAAALGFLTLNWSPAKIFMGDAGSTVLGFFFAVAPLLVWIEGKRQPSLWRLWVAAALALWPFLVDGTFTILRRLRKRENIFKAHRTHLYQRLVIAGQTHRSVTLAYGAFAILGGALAYWVVVTGIVVAIVSTCFVALLFVALWRWTAWEEQRARSAALASASPVSDV